MKEVLSYGHIEGVKLHPHRNRGMEITLVDRGHLLWAVDETPEELNAGDVFFTLPWQTHGSTAIREPKNKIYYILFQLREEYREPADDLSFPEVLGFSNAEEKLIFEALCGASRHAWNGSPLLKQLFPELIQNLKADGSFTDLVTSGLLRSIIIELARLIEEGGEYRTQINATSKRVKSFLDSLNGDLARSWTLDQMAEACGIKRTHFANIAQRHTGYSPLAYLGLLRFSKACSLLTSSDISITDIAFDCGYSSSQYFSDSFRKIAKMTPSQYRRDAPALQEILDSNWNNPGWRSIEEEQIRAREMEA